MQPTVQPQTIQVIGDELAIAWSDGVESFLALEFLRRNCPCASCAGEPDVLGQIDEMPENRYGGGSFALASYEFVGGYGLRLCWGDGHSTGIYSYQYLRRLGGA